MHQKLQIAVLCLPILMAMVPSLAQDTGNFPLGTDDGAVDSTDDPSLPITAGQSEILNMILDHQRQRDERIAELEARRAANDALLAMMRREALAVDLLIAQTRDASAVRSCTVAVEFAEEIMRQIQRTQSWIEEVERQCSSSSLSETQDQICEDYLEQANSELAELSAIDVTVPDQCAEVVRESGEEVYDDSINGAN